MYHCRIKPTVKTKLKIATLQHKLALYFSSRYNCYLNILVCRNFQVKESCCCRYMSYGLHDTPSSCCCAKEEMIYVYHVSNCFQMHVPAAVQLPLTASLGAAMHMLGSGRSVQKALPSVHACKLPQPSLCFGSRLPGEICSNWLCCHVATSYFVLYFVLWDTSAFQLGN